MGRRFRIERDARGRAAVVAEQGGGRALAVAVPRGLPAPGEKRLAVILDERPPGEWPPSAGWWEPAGDVAVGLTAGKLLFAAAPSEDAEAALYELVRTQKGWLLLGKDARFEPATRVALEAAHLGAPRRPLTVDDVPLMLAETAEGPFSRAGWGFELKYDGYRLVLGKAGGHPALRYRSGAGAAEVFPDVRAALEALPGRDLVLDAEVVVHDESGRPRFQRLQERTQLKRPADIQRAVRERPAVVHAFDLLAVDGYDLRPLPLRARKRLLKLLLAGCDGCIRYADHVEAEGVALFAEVRRMGLEGLMAKRLEAPYRGGRSGDWLKVKAERAGDFVVVGYTAPKGSRTGLGALHLAVFGEGDQLVYAGRVGSGLDEKELAGFRARLDETRVGRAPKMGGAPPDAKGSTWVEPREVVEVRYLDWPDGGVMRFPVFLRRREDKAAAECRVAGGAVGPGTATATVDKAELPRVKLSNLDKVFFPAIGGTKGEVVEYYRRVAPALLPFLADRPLAVVRHPDGVDGKSFFQKDAPVGAPAWLRTIKMWSDEARRELDHFVVDDVDALLWLANLGALPLHVWSSRAARLERPDWCVIDLDPPTPARFADAVVLARAFHALCTDIGLPLYVKTSGSKGLHLLVPLGGQCGFEEQKQLAQVLAAPVVAAHSSIATLERLPAARGGRVYVDCLQNGAGKLLAAPLCVRAVPDARISMPLDWSEVTATLDPSRYTIRTAPALIDAWGAHGPWSTLLDTRPDLLAALERLARR